ncbi:hypothetical protein [Lentzea waywayandensis]|uniref:hypothetical protein n=1 Tax=Lentzea waywayandensis TaxID=84724 RepID=UPI001160D3AA|nr:hypothetical protein [Lentzea waywayandensis]
MSVNMPTHATRRAPAVPLPADHVRASSGRTSAAILVRVESERAQALNLSAEVPGMKGRRHDVTPVKSGDQFRCQSRDREDLEQAVRFVQST